VNSFYALLISNLLPLAINVCQTYNIFDFVILYGRISLLFLLLPIIKFEIVTGLCVLFGYSGAPAAQRAAERSPIGIIIIFPWLSWLAVLLVGAYARRRRWSCPTWQP